MAFLGTSVRCRGSISISAVDISDGGAGLRFGAGVGSNIVSGSGVRCFLVGSAGPGGSSRVAAEMKDPGGSGDGGGREKVVVDCL